MEHDGTVHDVNPWDGGTFFGMDLEGGTAKQKRAASGALFGFGILVFWFFGDQNQKAVLVTKNQKTKKTKPKSGQKMCSFHFWYRFSRPKPKNLKALFDQILFLVPLFLT